MKIALLIVGSLAGLVSAIVVVGYLLPKNHVASRSATFKCSPERLFALISGPQDWRSDVAKYEALDSTRTKESWKDGTVIEYVVVRSEPPFRFERRIATDNLPFGGTWTFLIESSDVGSRLRITENGEVYNPLFRFIAKFVFGHTRTLEIYLKDLAAALNETPDIHE